MGFYTEDEVKKIGFKYVGTNVHISNKVSIYNACNISIGSNSRIDDFCVLSAGDGGIVIGDNVHIAVYASLIGKGKIVVKDFAGISARVVVYSSNDDYSGEYMTNPTVDEMFTNVSIQPVYIGKHVIIGAGSVVLPGVRLEEGACIGALSLVNKDCDAFCVYAGVPAVKKKDRLKNLLKLEQEFAKRGFLNESSDT